MKSPWKILTTLVSRRKGEADLPASNEEVSRPSEPITGTPLLLAQSDKATPSPKVLQIDATFADQAMVEEEDLAAGSTEEPAIDGDIAAQSASLVEVSATSPPKKRRQIQPERRPGAALTADASLTRHGPGQSPTHNEFAKSVADLNEEVKELRGSLAKKLRLQNAQLRRMLERFETSSGSK